MAFWAAVSEITPMLYLCSGQAAASKKIVTDKNISCIVNATRNLPDPVWNDVQIQTVSLHNIQLFVNQIDQCFELNK